MDDLRKTLTFVVIAIVVAGVATWSRLPAPTTSEVFSGEGQKFFPEFSDTNAAQALEVVEYDANAAKVNRFEVVNDGQFWKIPTHANYPADAQTRLAKSAGAVIDLVQDQYITSNAKDYAKLGVLNPEDTAAPASSSSSASTSGAGDPESRGKLIRLRKGGDQGTVLAEFIIGKPVPTRNGYRYVRDPGKKAVYASRIDAEISTKFADWIETNLLKIDTSKINKITFNHNHFDLKKALAVDPSGRRRADVKSCVIEGEVTSINRPSAGTWLIEGPPLLPDQELDTAKISALTGALGDVKIVGVRTKPPAFTKLLANMEASAKFFQPVANLGPAWFSKIAQFVPMTLGLSESAGALAERESSGFYIAASEDRDERGAVLVPTWLLPSASSVDIQTEDGLIYHLFFGEATLAQGDELTSGAKNADAAATKKADEKSKPENPADPENANKESRYLFVTVSFDPNLIPPPPPPDPVTPSEEDVVFEDPFVTPELKAHPLAEARALALKESAKRQEVANKARDEKIKTNQKRAKELAARFANWYYVTRGDAFPAIALKREALVKAKAPANANPGFPGGPGGPGFPGGPGGGLPNLPNFPGSP